MIRFYILSKQRIKHLKSKRNNVMLFSDNQLDGYIIQTANNQIRMGCNQEQIEVLTAALSTVIRRFLNQQQKQALQKNSSKYQSSEVKAKKNADDQQHIYLKTQSFYDESVNLLDKLKKIMKRMNTINKIKKPKLNIFNASLMQFIQQLSNLIESKVLNIRIDKYVVALVQQTNKALTQCDRILTSLEKQSGVFSCSRNDEQAFFQQLRIKYTFYRSIINIIGYGHVWGFVPKFSPLVQEKVQKIEIYTPIKYDMQNLEKLIQYLSKLFRKQISKHWPEERQREVQVIKEIKCQKSHVIKQIKCQKPHVDSQIIDSKQSCVSSLSESEQLEAKNLSQQIPSNYIQIEEVVKLKEDLELERLLRQTHEKLFGFGRSQQISYAIQNYKKIAEKKNDKSNFAFNALGQIYEEGKFTEVDRQKSQQYYRKSASMNDPEGLYKLGKYLEKGLIKIKQDNSQLKQQRNDQLRAAVEYYEKAAAMGHLDALTDLGYIYQKGIEYQSSFQKISQVSQNHTKNHSKNQDKNQKYFIEPNINHALKYYIIGKKAQFPRAVNNLGALLIRQHNLIKQRVKGTNLEKGVKYLRKAVQLGYLKAYYNIGKCFQHGIGVNRSFEHAKKYYLRGSEKGDISCKVEYIKCFYSGEFPKNAQNDDSQLAKLVEMVHQVLLLEPNNKECLFYMGLFYQRGDGVIKNQELAYNYVQRSATLNFLPAITRLGDYKYSGIYTKKDLPGAVKLYAKAAKEGDQQAMINLALVLEKGLIKPTVGSSPDYIRHLQHQALKTNNPNAYLIAGLREQHYRIQFKPDKQLNQKFRKSVQLGNFDTSNLIQKNRKNIIEIPVSSNLNQIKQITDRTIRNGMITSKIFPYQNILNRIKSADNLKTSRV